MLTDPQRSARLSAVLSIARHKPVSSEALRRHAADVALAARVDELLKRAQDTERVFREAQAAHASIADLHRLGKDLDPALPDVMRAPFPPRAGAIGTRGYDDRIYRRKGKATPAVR